MTVTGPVWTGTAVGVAEGVGTAADPALEGCAVAGDSMAVSPPAEDAGVGEPDPQAARSTARTAAVAAHEIARLRLTDEEFTLATPGFGAWWPEYPPGLGSRPIGLIEAHQTVPGPARHKSGSPGYNSGVIEDPTEQSAGGPSACPFVAFEDDRDHRSSKADYRHRCFAAPEPEPRAFPHQERYCLSDEFARCPIFLDWARQEAAAVKVPSAATRPMDITDDVAAAVANDEPIAPAFLAARPSASAANLSLPRRTPEANAGLWSYDGEGKRTKSTPAPTPPSSLGAPAVAMARRGPSHPGWENPPRLESFPRLRSREEHRANQPMLLLAIGVAFVMVALLLFPIIMTARSGAAAVSGGTLPTGGATPTTNGGSPSQSAPPNANGFFPYKVRSGDQMWAIAKYFNIQLDDLLAANPQVKDSSKIAAGDILQIPPIGWHATPTPH